MDICEACGHPIPTWQTEAEHAEICDARGSRVRLVVHQPRHQYDCGRCRFNWNCGPLCACFEFIGPPAPPQRAAQVERLQAEWRKSRGLSHAS